MLRVAPASAPAELQPETAMAAAAKALLASLDDAQRAKIRFAFADEERFNWHFIPRERQGLSLKAMTGAQRAAAFGLLKTGLSEKGYTKAETIRSLELILRALEKRDMRDPEMYFFTIFGEPGSGPWGWRYEGHHISQNWTIVGGKAVGTTPAFFGANPGRSVAAPSAATPAPQSTPVEPLAAEQQKARDLLAALTAEQRTAAITSATAPADILTTNVRKAAIIDNTGLAASAMTRPQQTLLMALIEEYASAQSPALAAQRMERVRLDGMEKIRFAWLGSTEPGLGHYYRVQGASFLIEYDNTQNNANHPHTVWRDFAGDFGVDLLAAHYAQDPHHRAQDR
jgi:hypothetical protein